MPEATRRAGRAARGTFTRHFLLPLTALVGTLGLALASSVFWLTAQQDQLQLSAERKQVRMAVVSRMKAIERNLGDYAVWDDAVRHLVIRFDRAWAIENIAPYLYRVQQYDFVFVLDDRNRTLIASAGGSLSNATPAAVLGQPFVTALRQLRLGPDGADRRLVGLTKIKGKPALFGLAAIVPSGDAKLPKRSDSFIIVVRLLDGPMLAELGEEFGIEALHDQTRPHAAHLGLINSERVEVGDLGWESASPGTALRRDFAPGLLLVILLMAGVGGVVLRHGRRALLNAIIARDEAKREAATARDALAELESARRRIAADSNQFRTTLKQTVAAAEQEHDRLIHDTLEQRRVEMIAVAEAYQSVVALVSETLEEAAEALSDVARAPCGQTSADQLLASAGDLQIQARFLETESRELLARLKAA